ncbi:MAG: agmatine deiminase family protein [Salinivirgaceae bacterium]|jgi:agmatine deiminase|nr:agmatine deiminase family protein [Salinivirgaceae bacterium]
MITDQQTNTVYFSNTLPEEFPEEFQRLSKIITDSGYKVKLLVGTEDFYCRDFMPVQVSENDFVQFVFRPEAYLKGEELQFLTDPMYVQVMTPGLNKPRYSPIILDGGNAIKGDGKVIITDRVLKDNRYQFSSDDEIIERLEFDVQSKVIIIPEFPNEETGHADGLIRFIDGNTVFINEPDPENKEWEDKLRSVLKENKLEYIELPCPFDPKMETAEGLFINYLHVGNLIVLPQFGYDEDKEALDIISNAFLDCKVVPFKANWIAKEGGVFNCMSWTVKE